MSSDQKFGILLLVCAAVSALTMWLFGQWEDLKEDKEESQHIILITLGTYLRFESWKSLLFTAFLFFTGLAFLIFG